MDRVIVKSKYNKKYHYKFYRFHLLHRSMVVYLVIFASLLSIYLAINTTLDKKSTLPSVIISWVFVLFFLTFLPAIYIGRIKGIVKNIEKERKDSYEIMEFTKSKITRIIENVEGKAILGWESFEAIYEFEDCYFLYIESDRGLVVVKSDIIEGDTQTFEKLAKKYMKPNKRGKINYKKCIRKE